MQHNNVCMFSSYRNAIQFTLCLIIKGDRIYHLGPRVTVVIVIVTVKRMSVFYH